MGTALLAVERCSLARVCMAAQDSRSAHGLLYFAAVQGHRHHLIRRNRSARTSAHVGLPAKTYSASFVVCR
jgi:hypothetical protein